jgi:hypothetical protein
MADIPWGELTTYKPFPTGHVFKGMEIGFAKNSAGV